MPVPKKQSPRAVSSSPHSSPAAGGSIVSRIRPVNEMAEGGIKMAIFGRSGTGKTTFAATFPKPILIGITSGANETRSIVNIPDSYGVKVESVEEMDELLTHYRESGKYKTFINDHGSGFQDLVLKKVLGLEQIPVQLSWGIAKQEQWGYVAQGVKEYFRKMLDLPGNTLILCQERTSNENSDSEILLPSVNCALTPSVTGWLGPAVDYLAQTFIRMETKTSTVEVAGKKVDTTALTGKTEFCLRIGPHPIYATKFRAPKGRVVPEVMVNPTYANFVKLVNG
jgi:hypothetical protein